MEYDYSKMEQELSELTEKMKTMSDIDKLSELGEKKAWLESKLKARDLMVKIKDKNKM